MNVAGFPLLSLLTWLPLVGCAVILAVRGDEETVASNARWTALWTSLIVFALSLLLWVRFDKADPDFQFVENFAWLPEYGVNYRMGVDGISVLFVLLSTALTPLCILASWESVEKNVREFMLSFLILETTMVGMFAALDFVVFYMFFEAVLIPMYLIIGVWGGPRRVYAAFKFFLYTLTGSVLMLLALLAMWRVAGTTDIAVLLKTQFAPAMQTWLFLAFFASFAVKVPMWPVHTWLPDAHVEAPTGGSVVLAAIMLKLGAYGFLRFSLPIAPDASRHWDWLIIALSLIAVLYIGLVALVQLDMKKLVAYSSIAHMGFVTLGFFIFSELGISGGIVQMISHGFISGAMFQCIGVLYDRVHSREIASYGGVVNTMPKFTALAVFFAMANCGLPGTSGFVGEWMVILGTVKYNFWLGLLAATTLVFGAAYTLWMVKRVYFGDVANDDVKALTDINRREFTMLSLLAVAVLWMGVYPKPFTDVMHTSVTQLIQHVGQSKLN